MDDLYHGWLHHAGHWSRLPAAHAATETACAVLLRAGARGLDHDDLIVMPVGQTPESDDSPSLAPAPERGWRYTLTGGRLLAVQEARRA